MSEEQNISTQTNIARARIFLQQNISAHIQKKDGYFYNGKILGISEDKTHFWINDRKIGKTLIFFQELKEDIREQRGERK